MNRCVRLLQSLCLSYMITGICLLILTFLLYKMSWSENNIHIGIVVTYILSTVAGGIYIGRKAQTKRLFFGILSGILYFGIIMLVSLLCYPEQMGLSGKILSIFCMCFGGGILGSIIS